MNKNILALDLGYGSIKVAYRTSMGQLRYQKLITIIGTIEKNEALDIKDEHVYEYESKSYYIGPSALRLPSKQLINITDYKTFRSVSPIIISYYLDLIQSAENMKFDSIVVGLSVAHAGESADYLRYLEGKLNLKVTVLPQGISSKFAIEKYGLDPTDESQATNVKATDYIGVDIGFNTIDVFSVIEGKSSVNASKGYESMGVTCVAEKLSKFVIQKHGIELSIQDYKNILEIGSLYYRGQRINLSSEIHDLVVDYLIQIIDNIETDYSEAINKVDRIIMIGGGANLIKRYIDDTKFQAYITSKYSGDFLMIPKIPEFYNVLGYFTNVENNSKS
jgi:hypothetical protein